MALILQPLRWLLTREAGLFELISGLCVFGWGVLTMQSFSPEDRPSSLGAYASLDVQYQAAAVAIVVGIGQAFVCGLIDANWPRHWLRFAAAALAMWLWLTLLVSAVCWGGWPIAPTAIVLAGMFVGNIQLLSRTIRRNNHGRQ